MHTQHHIRTPDSQINIPLLDKEFDLNAPDFSSYVFLQTQEQVEDNDIMNLNEK